MIDTIENRTKDKLSFIGGYENVRSYYGKSMGSTRS